MKFELLFLASLGLIVTAKKLSVLPPSYPYIMTIGLIFNDDNISDFITESFFTSINEDLDANKNCNITLYDILSILPTENLIPAVNELNISLQGDEVTQLIRGLNYLELVGTGFSAKKVYRNVVNAYFQNATQDLLSCLNILEIAAEFTTAYAFGTDEELFQAFQKGNFSIYNLQEISAIVNIPLDGISNILGLKHYDTPYIKSIVNNNLTDLLIARGLEKEGFRKFLDAFELEVDNFKKVKSFKNFYKLHTEEESLGVAVGPNEVITNDNSIIEGLKNLDGYVSVKVKSLQNSKMKYLVAADKVQEKKEGISRILIEEGLLNYINETKDYQEVLTKNCTYVTQDFKHRLIARNVSVSMNDTKLTLPKLLGMAYKKSSPLICESLLYGLAEINNIDSILFTKVGEEENVGKVDEQEEDVAKVEEHEEDVAKIDSIALNNLLDLLTNFLQLFDACSHTSCKINIDGVEAESQVESQTETQFEDEAQNQFENEAQKQSVTEAHTQPEIEAQSQSENEEISLFGDNAQPQNDVQVQSEIDVQNQPANETGSQAEAQTQNENETLNQSEIKAEIPSETKVQNLFESEGKSEPEVQSETEVYIQPEIEVQNENEARGEPEAQILFQNEVQSQSENEAQGEPQAQIQFQNEVQSQPEIEIQTEAVTDPQTQSDSDVQFEFETENEFHAVADVQIDSDIQFTTEKLNVVA